MFRFEDKKEESRFPITKISKASKILPELGQAEWECCHTREEAIKWHLKWTPWWTKDMIEGIVDKAYLMIENKEKREKEKGIKEEEKL